MDISVENAPAAPGPKREPGTEPETDTEVLVMDAPRGPGRNVALVFAAVAATVILVIAGNWGYLSEMAREDREKPKISPIMTRSDGFAQKVKFTVGDDRNLPLNVRLRVHFWNASNETVPMSEWSEDLSLDYEVHPGETIVQRLPYLPNTGNPVEEGWYSGWYVWVHATDLSGKKTTAERVVFPTQWDPGY